MDFWLYQNFCRLHNHHYPNKNTVKTLMKNCPQGQNNVKKSAFYNQKKRIIADGYNKQTLWSIFNQFWQQSHSNKLAVVRDNLQAHLNYLLEHFFFTWEKSRQFRKCSDLKLLIFNKKCLLSCLALLYIMSNKKIN